MDKAPIKTQLVPLMISLGTPQTAKLQSQIGKGWGYIISLDFPDDWEGLCDVCGYHTMIDNFVINNGVLATAHSIFKRWRSQFRTNELYSEIKFVLSRFCEPYYQIFQHVDKLLQAPSASLPPKPFLPLLSQTLLSLIQLFHDLSSQGLPLFFEDYMPEFMGGDQPGWLRKYLDWEMEELKGDEDDGTSGLLQKIRSAICEIAELYAQKYSDVFT
nr:hypothetical protein L203_01617 [Cryptococcus depauperatus CBS 7841]